MEGGKGGRKKGVEGKKVEKDRGTREGGLKKIDRRRNQGRSGGKEGKETDEGGKEGNRSARGNVRFIM